MYISPRYGFNHIITLDLMVPQASGLHSSLSIVGGEKIQFLLCRFSVSLVVLNLVRQEWNTWMLFSVEIEILYAVSNVLNISSES